MAAADPPSSLSPRRRHPVADHDQQVENDVEETSRVHRADCNPYESVAGVQTVQHCGVKTRKRSKLCAANDQHFYRLLHSLCIVAMWTWKLDQGSKWIFLLTSRCAFVTSDIPITSSASILSISSETKPAGTRSIRRQSDAGSSERECVGVSGPATGR